MTISDQADFSLLSGISDDEERYNLEKAAYLIAKGIGENPSTVLEGLAASVEKRDLRVYRPGRQLAYLPRIVRAYYEEIFWDDLNKWLDRETRGVCWRFTIPNENSQSGPKRQDSGLPFQSPPTRKDDWYNLIEEMMFAYRKEYGSFPDAIKAWSYLWGNPTKGNGVSTGKDSGGEDALRMTNNTLGKSNFRKRFSRWTKIPN